MHRRAVLVHLRLVGQLRRQLQPDPVRVKKVNALENIVVGHAQHFYAVSLKSGFHRLQIRNAVYPKRNMVDPQGRVGRRQCRLVIAEVKKRDERTIPEPKEKVGVWAVFTSARHVVALDNVVQRQTEDVFIKMPGFLGIARAVGVVVQLLDGRRGRQTGCWNPGFCQPG